MKPVNSSASSLSSAAATFVAIATTRGANPNSTSNPTATFEAPNEAAKRGNRPRFRRRLKLFRANKNNSNYNNGDLHFQRPIRGDCCEQLFATLIILILCLVSALALPPINCDQDLEFENLSARVRNGRELSLQAPAPEHISSPNVSQTFDQSRPQLNRSQLELTHKIAALTTKLEHWFNCHRLKQLTANQLISEPTPPEPGSADGRRSDALEVAPLATCRAHFDGHLCWPEVVLGQSIELPCPRLNYLFEVQQQVRKQTEQFHLKQSKFVINDNPSDKPSLDQSVNSNQLAGLITIVVDDKSNQTKEQESFARFKCQPGSPLLGNQSNHLEEQHNRSSDSIISNLIESPLANYSDCLQAAIGGQSATALAPWLGAKTDQSAVAFDPTDNWIKLDQDSDKKLLTNLADELERIEGPIDPYSDPDLHEQWLLCIGNIMRKQQSDQEQRTSLANEQLWCPIIFDGWRCWPSTRANQIAYVGCPKNQPGFSAEREAHKICTTNGTWYKHPQTNRYWSNYTTCVDTVDLAFRTKILSLYVFGNLISLVALSASLIIFISFKSLNCTRVTIHKNLFLSFIVNNLMWIIWYTYVVNDAMLLQANPVECQIWHILLHYFLVSNYFWMFCEGLYLHTLLVVAFVSEDKILKWFYLLGWLTPVPITIAYAYQRSYDENYTNFCWMDESPYNLILMAPIGISLLLNLIFLINIVRVLVTKLRANNSPDTHQTRKAVRATLILIPLLGLHYILTPFRPEEKSEWEKIYEFIAAVCTSFQGLCVALLFCFCNGEVIAVLKKKLKSTFNLKGHAFNDDYQANNNAMRSRSNTIITTTNMANANTTTSLQQAHAHRSSSIAYINQTVSTGEN